MKWRPGLVLLLLCGATTAGDKSPRSIEEFHQRIVRFEHEWGQFITKLCGWKDTPTSEPCRPDAPGAHVDRRQFGRARDAAKILFDLE